MTQRSGKSRVAIGPDVDYAAVFMAIPTSYLVMVPEAPHYTILSANQAYLDNVGRELGDIVGRPVFEAFPPSPDTLDENGVPRIRLSFERALATKRQDSMPLQKYDVPNATGTGMVERYWSLISVPIVDVDGEVVLLVQRAENITDFVLEQQRGEAERERGELWRRRVEEVEGDLFARAQELASAVREKELASRRLASLAEVTLQLGSAETVEDLTEVIFSSALPVLHASGASIAVRTPGNDVLHLTVTASIGSTIRRRTGELPLYGPQPSSLAARGSMVLIPNEQAAAGYAGLADEFTFSGSKAAAVLPLQLGNRLLGSLSFGFAEPQAFPADEVELLRAFATQCAQVLDRLQVRAAERRAAAEVQRIAETLQRSLLTAPPASSHLRFAVSYQPAQQVAQVGGDWYDAFNLADGTTNIVIGDVAGHDQDAAATMAQVRNILRGVAQTIARSPAVVLESLDCALHELELGVLATVVLAQISRPTGPDDARTMRWCNAGHPPPLLVRANGAVELLARHPNLLVGMLRDTDRADYELTLLPGDTVLLYTDGLAETRGGDIEDDIERLRQRVTRHDPGDGPQALIDLLISDVDTFNDDVALLAVQAL
ncbi:MAG: putative sensor protein [Frankiales bacterium]|nr:putative sensor protein [Frankiales bacterium]